MESVMMTSSRLPRVEQRRRVFASRNSCFSSAAICAVLAAVACLSLYAWPISNKSSTVQASSVLSADSRVKLLTPSLSFEPDFAHRSFQGSYSAKLPGYRVQLQKRAILIRSASSQTHAGSGQDAIRIGLSGAHRSLEIAPSDQLPGFSSYFPTSDPATWITKVPNYGRITYRRVYSGVDLSFYGTGKRIEYDFMLNAGADPAEIRLAISGAGSVKLDAAGNLLLTQGKQGFTFLKPRAYQKSADGSESQPVDAEFAIERSHGGQEGDSVLTFHLGKYDRRKPLVIDPVLVYGLYLPGASGFSESPYYFADTLAEAMTADGQGNTYLAARVDSEPASFHVFKFDPSGNLLLNVSLGGANSVPTPQAIAVGAHGEIYVAGSTPSNFLTTPGAFQPSDPASSNTSSGFLTVISADGSALIYSTYLGGNNTTEIEGEAIDSTGNVFVAGVTSATNFPTTPGVYEHEVPQEYGSYAFVSKFNPSLSGAASLLYSTYLAPQTLSNSGNSFGVNAVVAVDSQGAAYVASSASTGFPVTNGAYQYDGITAGGAFLTKLSADASTLAYSAFLGPGQPKAIAVDSSGEAYVAGTVTSADFPTTPGAYQSKYPGGFALELNSKGSSLVYSTFLSGPSGVESYSVTPTGIAIPPGCASACPATIAGSTTTVDFPLIHAIQGFPSSNSAPNVGFPSLSGFLVGLKAGGSVDYSTYLGAATSPTLGAGSVPAVALDNSGNVYFASNIEGSDAPTTLPAVLYAGEGYLAKISPGSGSAVVAVPSQVVFDSTQPVRSTTTMTSAVEVRNMGDLPLELKKPFEISSSEFSQTDNCPSTLAAGALCTVNISFTPQRAGNRSATLSVSSSTGTNTARVHLSGTAVDGFSIAASPSSIAFNDQLVDTSSSAVKVVVRNSGDRPVAIQSVTSSLPDYVASGNCKNAIAAGASCELSVQFKPTQLGLRSGYVLLQIEGFYYYNGEIYVEGLPINLTGSGVLSSSGTGTLAFSQTGINFGDVVVHGSAISQSVALMNTGDALVTVNSIAVTTNPGEGAPGDFILPSNSTSNYPEQFCGYTYPGTTFTVPFVIGPQSGCSISVRFDPAAPGSKRGTLSVKDSASGSPHRLALSGIGLNVVQALTIYPPNLSFPAQPVGVPSAVQTFYITNSGEDYVAIDRAVTTGDFAISDIGNANCEGALLGPQVSCELQIAFLPSAAGARTGTLVLTDSASRSPQVFNLAGEGIVSTGGLIAGQSSLTFPQQVKGTTSAPQEIVFSNPGNSVVTINSITTTGDFAVDTAANYLSPSECGTSLPADSTCAVDVLFSPTASSGTESGSLTVHSTGGDVTVQLSGTATSGAQSIAIAPSTANFGSVLKGVNTGSQAAINIYVINTGASPVTFPSAPSLTGPVADFLINGYGCDTYIPSSNSNTGQIPMPPGVSCDLQVNLSPSQLVAESATLKLVDSAGAQSVKLTGTGVSVLPAVTLSPQTFVFDQQAVGTTSSKYNYDLEIYLYNNGKTSITINSVNVTAGSSDFTVNSQFQSCAGVTVQAGQSCSTTFVFAPSVAGYRTGTVTFEESNGTKYTAALAGYAVAAVDSAAVFPQALVLPATTVVGASSDVSGSQSAVYLMNQGNTPLTVGTISTVNVSSTGDFNTSGGDQCSGAAVPPGEQCSVTVGFTPRALGSRTGSITFPVTYADNTTASLTATLAGTGINSVAGASLTPQSVYFASEVAGPNSIEYFNQQNLVITNTGNQNITVGPVTGKNLTTTAGKDGDFFYQNSCSNEPISPGSTCTMSVGFAPLAAGQRSGSLSVHVTFAGGATSTLTSNLFGTAVAPKALLDVTPAGLNFNVEVVGTNDTQNVETVFLTPTGNTSVNVKSVTASRNFTITQNECSNSPIQLQLPCQITVAFTPAASTPAGNVKGTLTVVDDAPGSPQVVALQGTAVAAAQQLALSQTSVSFASQAVGSASPIQTVYLVDLGPTSDTGPRSSVEIKSIQLGGKNAGDFTESETCGGSLGFFMTGRSECTIVVGFSPGKQSLGTRTASVTITPVNEPVLTIQLIGSGVAAPAAKPLPQSPQAPGTPRRSAP
jgi:hypothetical protein